LHPGPAAVPRISAYHHRSIDLQRDLHLLRWPSAAQLLQVAMTCCTDSPGQNELHVFNGHGDGSTRQVPENAAGDSTPLMTLLPRHYHARIVKHCHAPHQEIIYQNWWNLKQKELSRFLVLTFEHP
jgi:hypothetical protein